VTGAACWTVCVIGAALGVAGAAACWTGCVTGAALGVAGAVARSTVPAAAVVAVWATALVAAAVLDRSAARAVPTTGSHASASASASVGSARGPRPARRRTGSRSGGPGTRRRMWVVNNTLS
jgi:hypothetical protein